MPLALQRRTQGYFPCRASLADSAVAFTSTVSNSIALVVNAPPTATWVAPMDGTTFTAPANIVLSASDSDIDGSISQVDFYNGTTLIGTVLAGSPGDTGSGYTTTWSNVAPGTYQLTAKATDNNGARVTTTSVTVTVNATAATIYYIHPDHLGTPRAITTSDTTNTKVWEWNNEDAFGNNAPNEDPSATGTAFKYNLRFPGQYFDVETNTSYNVNRDYDALTGRYLQSDPLGLKAGFGTYGYVSGNPLRYVDPFGLCQIAVWRGGYIIGWNLCDQPAVPSPPSSPPPSSPVPQCDSCGNPTSPPARQWSPDIPLADMSGVYIPPNGGTARVKTCYYVCAAAVTATGGIKDGLAHSADHLVQHQVRDRVSDAFKTGTKWATRGLTCMTLLYTIPSGVNNCYLTCGMDRLRD